MHVYYNLHLIVLYVYCIACERRRCGYNLKVELISLEVSLCAGTSRAGTNQRRELFKEIRYTHDYYKLHQGSRPVTRGGPLGLYKPLSSKYLHNYLSCTVVTVWTN